MDYYKCPFCGGTKTKQFVRNGTNQDCTECNHEGLISQKKVSEQGIEGFIDGYVKPIVNRAPSNAGNQRRGNRVRCIDMLEPARSR